MSITIRPAVEGDFDAIAAIYAVDVLHHTATFELEAPSASELFRRATEGVDRGLEWFVADEDGSVIGYAYAAPFRLRPAYRFSVETSIYVDRTQHGRGVGRRLMEAVIRQCARMGVRQLMAVIGDSANVGSIGLHRALGFRDAGVWREVGFKFDRWLDVVVMQLDLGPNAAREPGLKL